MKSKKELILLTLIFLLALLLRFSHLTSIPNGFNQDESAIGYNAYSILQTGKDEYGKAYPIYFKSFGDQKLPAYIYLTAISEKIFGINEFAVRFPSALLGSLAVLIIYFVIKEISQNEKLAILTSLFLALNPWHLFFSRAAFEDNVALTFSLFGVWMFLKGIRSKQWLLLFLSMLGFALSLYSYNVTRLLAPVLLAGLIWMNRKPIKLIPTKIKTASIIFLTILLLPFLLTFFTKAGAASAHGALITSTDIQAKSLEMRSYLVGSGAILGKIFFNKYIYLLWQYCQNLIASLSTTFFFITGSPHGSQGIGNMGTFYLIEFPLILIGLITIVQNKLKKFYFFILWAIITWLTLSLSKEVPHATRGYFLVIPFEVFSALGFLTLTEKIQQLKTKKIKIILASVIGILIFYNLGYYFTSYYFRFPLSYAQNWRQQDEPLAKFLKTNDQKYNKVIIDTNTGFIYTSLLFFTEYPPQQFQQTVKRAPDDSEGFSYVQSFGKYEWKNVEWDKDSSQPKTLIILPVNKVPGKTTPTAIFKYPQIPVVLSVKEQLAQYPTQETAYVAIETK